MNSGRNEVFFLYFYIQKLFSWSGHRRGRLGKYNLPLVENPAGVAVVDDGQERKETDASFL